MATPHRREYSGGLDSLFTPSFKQKNRQSRRRIKPCRMCKNTSVFTWVQPENRVYGICSIIPSNYSIHSFFPELRGKVFTLIKISFSFMGCELILFLLHQRYNGQILPADFAL